MKDSEYTCEVVKVVEVQKHPNADKLEVVKFAWADGTVPEYQCVAGKGDFNVDSVAVYISSDSLVPVSSPEFEFLKKRLDYKVGASHYRIKAAKIRGVISTGMLLPLDGKFAVFAGQDMSSVLGVVKYVRPEDVEPALPLVAYGQTSRPGFRIFRRLRDWVYTDSLKSTIPDYSVLSLRKVPALFTEGETVVVTEKVHGSAIRVGKVGGRILIGSHHTIKTDHRSWISRLLFPKKSSGSWYGKDIFTAWANSVFPNKEALSSLPEGIVFYGEIYGGKIQDLDYGRTEHHVVVFDAYDLKAKRWLTRLELLTELPGHLSMPPVLWEGAFDSEKMKRVAEYGSKLSLTSQLMEGVVVRSQDYKKAGKWVSNRYLTRA